MSNDRETVHSAREVCLDSIIHVRRPGAALGVKLEFADPSDPDTPKEAIYKLSMYDGTRSNEREPRREPRQDLGVLGYMTGDGRLILSP